MDIVDLRCDVLSRPLTKTSSMTEDSGTSALFAYKDDDEYVGKKIAVFNGELLQEVLCYRWQAEAGGHEVPRAEGSEPLRLP